MSSRKVFVIAMDNEAAAVTAHLECVAESTVFGRRVVRGTLGGEPTAVVYAGIGKTNAAAAAQLALSLFNPDELLNVGVAGALHARMKVAEVYQVRAAVQYDFDLAQLNGTKIGTLNEYTDREFPCATKGPLPTAVLATGDRFNDSEVDYRFLVDDVKADLRDMEGAAIAHVARKAGIPFRSLKSVSDVHGTGSTTDQYLANLKVALASLSAAVPAFFNA